MFCKNCGKELKDGVLFCGECGSKVENIPQNERVREISQDNPSVDSSGGATAKKPNLKLLILIIGAVILIVVLVVIVVSLFFGNHLSVNDVKNGCLTDYSENKTIEEVFDTYSYIDDISWEKVKGENDDGEETDVVVLDAEIEMIDYETESNINRDISFRFQKEDDQKNGEFFLNKILIEDEDDDIELIGEDFNNIIDCIYNNEMFTLNSGNKLTVQDVKTSYLTYYSEDKTIEEAFSNYSYFDDISWEEFDGTLDNGENVDIVEFDAEIKMYDYETEFDVTEDISFQFYRDDNMKGDESQIYGIFIGDEEYDELIQLDDYDFVDIINCIYEDEQFVFMGEDYGVHY